MNLIQAIEKDVEDAWGAVEHMVVADTKAAWLAIKAVWLVMEPKQWGIIQGLVAKARADIGSGDFADMVTHILNQAEAAELAWVQELGSEVLTAVIAIFKAKPAA